MVSLNSRSFRSKSAISKSMGVASVLMLLSIWFLKSSEFTKETLKSWQFSPIASKPPPSSIPSHPFPPIPNIVHYAYVLEDVKGDFNLKLEDFISVYSSLLYLNPETIYIHTDASPETIARARSPNSPSKWARLIFELPRVVVRYDTAPQYANNGEKINDLSNRSDFLRAKVVYELGGIYFDFDVFPLRDFKPFREAGFANVVGLEKYDNVNTGCFMSVKGSELMRVWLKHQHIVYDGGWITHAVILFTNICRRIHRIPYEVLILDKETWAPSSWEVEDASYLFSSHLDHVPPKASESDLDQERELRTSDLESVWENAPKLESWQRDWSATYAIHAFKSDISQIENFEGYSVKYILSRQSNLARALYPAVTHAIEAGYISSDD